MLVELRDSDTRSLRLEMRRYEGRSEKLRHMRSRLRVASSRAAPGTHAVQRGSVRRPPLLLRSRFCPLHDESGRRVRDLDHHDLELRGMRRDVQRLFQLDGRRPAARAVPGPLGFDGIVVGRPARALGRLMEAVARKLP
jgi:hypothetical protein